MLPNNNFQKQNIVFSTQKIHQSWKSSKEEKTRKRKKERSYACRIHSICNTTISTFGSLPTKMVVVRRIDDYDDAYTLKMKNTFAQAMKMISELFLVLTLSIIGIYSTTQTYLHNIKQHLPQFIENHTFKENFPHTNKAMNGCCWAKWQWIIQSDYCKCS